MKIYLKILSLFYLIGGILHILDVCGLRLKFAELSVIWQVWIIYLMIFDIAVAIGLWQLKKWGIILFFVVALSQLIAYIGFMNVFGHQIFLIGFHLVTLIGYAWFYLRFQSSSGV